MRILTVRQPWAWAIIHGGKDVENRVRNIAGGYRGPVAIHAAKNIGTWNETESALQMIHVVTGRESRGEFLRAPRGAIIGVVDLVDVHPVANPHFHPICYDLADPNGLLAAAARGDGACSRWAHPEGRWHLKLANPSPLADPIPYRGSLGLRKLDEYTGALVSASLAASALRKFADDIANGGPR